jgi:hypothetical protein
VNGTFGLSTPPLNCLACYTTRKEGPVKRRTLAAIASLPLFVALALPSPGRAFSGPPEEVSGKMEFDEVAEGQRKYHKEKDPKKRLAWLQTLGATGDPRVALALVDAADNQNGDDLDCEAADILWWRYASPDAASFRGLVNHDVIKAPPEKGFRPWWKANGADVRRRAALLPR